MAVTTDGRGHSHTNLLEASAEPNVAECRKHSALSNNIIVSVLFSSKRVALKIIHSLPQRDVCRGEFGLFISKRGVLHFHNDHSPLALTIGET
jgi:hypothetical protein